MSRLLLFCLLGACVCRPTLGFQALGPSGRTRGSLIRLDKMAAPPSSCPCTARKSFHLQMSAAPSNPTKAAATRTAGRKRLAACMAFLAGWGNIVTFTKFKSFATMLTGNTIWLAVSATEGKWRDVAYYSSVLGSYLFGTAVFRRTDLSLRKQTLPVCAALVAFLFILGDWVHFATTSRCVPMMLFAAAFGIINSLGTEIAGTLTFVVTGHLTRLVNQLVDRWSRTAGREKLTEAQKTAVVLNSSIYGGFFAGCVFATILSGFGLLNRFGVLSAIGISHAALWLAHDIEALGGAWWLRKDGAMCELDDDGEPCDIEDETASSTTSSTAVSEDLDMVDTPVPEELENDDSDGIAGNAFKIAPDAIMKDLEEIERMERERMERETSGGEGKP